MASRRDIKDIHEVSVLKSFEKYLEEQGYILEIDTRPDPPDAFVTINDKKTWVEITDAFYSKEIAISITSYAADDKIHQPAIGGLAEDPSATVLEVIESVITEKLNKGTMSKLAKIHGKGILLVGYFGPFFDINDTVNNLLPKIENKALNQSVFSSIYIYEQCSEKVHKYRKLF